MCIGNLGKEIIFSITQISIIQNTGIRIICFGINVTNFLTVTVSLLLEQVDNVRIQHYFTLKLVQIQLCLIVVRIYLIHLVKTQRYVFNFRYKHFFLTLTSISPILFSARMIGRPTIEGKIKAGKLLPAYPHFTNWNKVYVKWWISRLSDEVHLNILHWTYPSTVVANDNFPSLIIHNRFLTYYYN